MCFVKVKQIRAEMQLNRDSIFDDALFSQIIFCGISRHPPKSLRLLTAQMHLSYQLGIMAASLVICAKLALKSPQHA